MAPAVAAHAAVAATAAAATAAVRYCEGRRTEREECHQPPTARMDRLPEVFMMLLQRRYRLRCRHGPTGPID